MKFAVKNSLHNVQTKGGGVKGLLNNVKKKLHFSYGTASLTHVTKINTLSIVRILYYCRCKMGLC